MWYFRQNSFEDIRTIHDWIAYRKEMAKTPEGKVVIEIADSDKNEPLDLYNTEYQSISELQKSTSNYTVKLIEFKTGERFGVIIDKNQDPTKIFVDYTFNSESIEFIREHEIDTFEHIYGMKIEFYDRYIKPIRLYKYL